MQSMVQQTMFGLDARPDGLHVAPFVPAQLHRQHFGAQRTIGLQGLNYRGKALDVTLQVPKVAAKGFPNALNKLCRKLVELGFSGPAQVSGEDGKLPAHVQAAGQVPGAVGVRAAGVQDERVPEASAQVGRLDPLGPGDV